MYKYCTCDVGQPSTFKSISNIAVTLRGFGRLLFKEEDNLNKEIRKFPLPNNTSGTDSSTSRLVSIPTFMVSTKMNFEMLEESEDLIRYLPTEVMDIIFKYLTPKDLAICQQICKRWKHIIDFYFKNENYWKRRLKIDFPDICNVVIKKCQPNLPYNNIYKSLTLWPYIDRATEISTNFACPTTAQAEIKGFIILKHNLMGVHTHGGVYYWNLNTMWPITRGPIYGNFLKYYEAENVIVILGFTLNLYVIWPIASNPFHYNEVRFTRVRTFLVHEREVYIVFSNDEITLCELNTPMFRIQTLKRMKDRVVALGYSNQLNILTYRRCVYKLTNNEIVLHRAFDLHCNMMEVLRRYNFLENIDWRTFMQWIFAINHRGCQAALQDITIVKRHADLYFVGTLWGVVRIYNKPYINGELNIFRSVPLKEYNFMEMFCFSFPLCPILAIDVIEDHRGHRLFIGMPKGIYVLHFHHAPTENVIREERMIRM